MVIFIAYICLKVFENDSLCCIITSSCPIFLCKTFWKNVILRKKEVGGALFRGGGRFLEKKFGSSFSFSSFSSFQLVLFLLTPSRNAYRVINLDWKKVLSLYSQMLHLNDLELIFLYSTMFDVFCVQILLVCVNYFVHNINLK